MTPLSASDADRRLATVSQGERDLAEKIDMVLSCGNAQSSFAYDKVAAIIATHTSSAVASATASLRAELEAERRRAGEREAKIDRVMQTVKGIGGNCLAACLASIFKVPLESLPDMCPKECFDTPSIQGDIMKRWLATMDLSYVEIDLSRPGFNWTDGSVPDSPCLIAVKSNTPEVAAKGYGHFVVGYVEQRGNEVMIYVNHDPNGDLRHDYVPTAIGLFVPRSLARIAAQSPDAKEDGQ